jgi:hypothetical protein
MGVIMDKLLPILLIAGIVILIFLSSHLCERRVQKFSDEFCKAFIEASDHLLDVPLNGDKLIYTVASTNEDAINVDATKVDATKVAVKFGKAKHAGKTVRIKPAPLEEQPETLRKLFEKGIDDFVLDRFKTMHIKRDGAQLNYSPLNMIEKKYNGAMNRIYDIANISFSALEDFSVLKTQEDIDDFHFFLYQQDFIRNTTLSSIISKDAKKCYTV